MASYKMPCIQCGALIDRNGDFCPVCGTHSPFGYHCPDCRKSVEKEQRICSSCGRPLYVTCPACGQTTFVQDACEHCGASLMVPCPSKKCGYMNFFDAQKCFICSKKLKAPGTEKKRLFGSKK